MQLNNDAETHHNVLLVVRLQEPEHEGEDLSEVHLELLIAREAVDHLQDQLAELLQGWKDTV